MASPAMIKRPAVIVIVKGKSPQLDRLGFVDIGNCCGETPAKTGQLIFLAGSVTIGTADNVNKDEV